MRQRQQVAAADGFHAECVRIAGAVVIHPPGFRRYALSLPRHPCLLDRRRGIRAVRETGENPHPLALHDVGFPVVGGVLSLDIAARLLKSLPPHGHGRVRDMARIEIERARQRRDEEVAVLVRNRAVAAGEAFRGVVHGLHAVGQQVTRAAGMDQCPRRVGEIRGGVLVLALQEWIDDRAFGVLVPDAEPAHALDRVKVFVPGNLERLPRTRGEVVASAHYRLRSHCSA